MFNRMSLQAKLLSLSGAMSFILAAVATNAYFSLARIDEVDEAMAHVQLPNLITLADLESSEKLSNIKLRLVSSRKFGTPEFEKAHQQFEHALGELEKSMKTFDAAKHGPGVDELWKPTKAQTEKVLAFMRKTAAQFLKGDAAAARDATNWIADEMPALQADFDKFDDKLQERVGEILHDGVERSDQTIKLAYRTLLFGSLFGIIFALFVGFLTARGLSKTLLGLADRLTNGSREVASATHSIAEAGTELSASATEQAAALQQTVASLEEVSAMVNKSADNARRSLETSAKSQDAADKGKRAVQEMIGSMDEINRSNSEIMGQVEQSNREISEIVKVIGEIGNKTKVINDIVFQTKLLSFNASVEAARAGEHGKGFAVVAEEVGNLAQMSGNAAKEISGMLEESIRKVQGIADDTKTKVEKLVLVGKEKVQTGSETANRCASVLEDIYANVAQVNQMVEEISTACREQAQGVQEINKAMGQLDQVTQQNSAAAQQSASAAEQLRSQTTDLDSVVSTLHQTLQGGGAGTPVPSSAETARKPAPVIPLKGKAKAETATPKPARLKRVVGGDPVPSEDDPRFEDV